MSFASQGKLQPEKRTRLLKCKAEFLQLEGDSTDIFAPGIFDRYASRPDSQHFINMTLALFAVWYDVDGCDGSVGSGARQPRSQLQNNLGWVHLPRKQACLRIYTSTDSRKSW